MFLCFLTRYGQDILAVTRNLCNPWLKIPCVKPVFIHVPSLNERLYRSLVVLGVLAMVALQAYRLSPRQAKLLLGLLGMGVVAFTLGSVIGL